MDPEEKSLKESFYVVRRRDGRFLGKGPLQTVPSVLDARRFPRPDIIDKFLEPTLKVRDYERSDYETCMVEVSVTLVLLSQPNTQAVRGRAE